MALWLSVLVVSFATLLLYLYNVLHSRPEKIRRALRNQGIRGPHPLFLIGNIRDMKRSKAVEEQGSGEDDGIKHDFSSTIFPYFDRWTKIYGPTFMFSVGPSVSLYVGDPGLMKEICLSKSLDLGKPGVTGKRFGPLFGKGIIASSGAVWAIQRKIIAPEFFIDKVKSMVDLIVESALPLLKSWDARLEREAGVADIKVDEDLKSFSADVLSKACFGSNYAEGEKIFSKITSLERVLSIQSMFAEIPGSRFLPTSRNREAWRLANEIKSLIQTVIRERKGGKSKDKDFLQSIIRSAIEAGEPESFIIDNCKNIYFAGQDTTTTAAKWVLLLLAHNPEWQIRVRKEVMEVYGGDHKPDSEKLKKMNLLTQVIQETLRLYPASPVQARHLYKDMEFGDLHIPKGTTLWVPTLQFHHNPELWGPNADQFNPERFAKGVSGACKHPHMYLPFGFGPHTCLGQNFAMANLKVVISLILARYKVSPSPNHHHSVQVGLMLGSKFGVHVMVERV